jgi:hypothetical protein
VPSWVWHQLLGRFSKELIRRDVSPSFRGSLVDDKMFAIDVAEWGMEDVLRDKREARQMETKIKLPTPRNLAHFGQRKKVSA